MSARQKPAAPARGRRAVWRLGYARARLSEIIRLARDSGPQRVTIHGQESVVVLSAADYAQLVSPERSRVPGAKQTLAELLANSPFARLTDVEMVEFDRGLHREPGRWREQGEF